MDARRSRLGRIRWWLGCPPELCARFEGVRDALRQQLPSERDVLGAVNLLCHFVREFNAGLDDSSRHPLDLSTLSATAADASRARDVWSRMRARGGWRPKHLAEVRVRLARALACVVPGLAYAVNPAMRRRGVATRYVTTRSHRTHFELHECLPGAVRRLGDGHVEYRLLERLGAAMADVVGSVSREGLCQILRFLDRLLHGPRSPAWTTGDLEARWTHLRTLTGLEWLQRYALLFPQTRSPPGHPPRRVSLRLLRRELRWLNLLHGKVLHAGRPDVADSIPLPRRSGRSGGALPPASAGNQSADASSSGTELDQRALERRQRMIDAVCALRAAAIGDDELPPDRAPPRTFTPDEVRRIVLAAESTRERLMVMLFLTTGLRRGGLARLRGPAAAATVTHARDVPRQLSTVEKNNRRREVQLSPTVRVLMAHWYRWCRGLGDRRGANPYVFPDRAGDGHAHEATVAQVCAAVMARAGIVGGHVHAFRHTVVKILWMKGNSFEQIAKWIGHRSVSITANDYGHLAAEEIQSRMVGLDWLGPPAGADDRRAWSELTDFLYAPYTFAADEWPA